MIKRQPWYWQILSDQLAVKTHRGTYPPALTREFYLERGICQQALFIRRSACEQVGGYDASYLYMADFAWWLKATAVHQLKCLRLEMPAVFSTAGGAHSRRSSQLRSYSEKMAALSVYAEVIDQKGDYVFGACQLGGNRSCLRLIGVSHPRHRLRLPPSTCRW